MSNPMVYVGCYTDDTNVPRKSIRFSDNNRDKCIQFCSDNFYFLASLRNT